MNHQRAGRYIEEESMNRIASAFDAQKRITTRGAAA